MSRILVKKMMLLSWVFVFSLFIFGENVFSSSTTISPTNSEFASASNVTYNVNSTYYGSTTLGSTSIFHFKPSSSGAYNIYSGGYIDTVGALFYKKTVFFITSYPEITWDNDSGYQLNFRIERDLNAGRDYYAAVRGYGTTTGSYRFSIEENQDKIYAPSGGYWHQNSQYLVQDVNNNWQIDPMIRTLYTADQTAVLYEMLDLAIMQEIQNKYINNYNDAAQEIMTYLLEATSFAATLSSNLLLGLITNFISSYYFQLALEPSTIEILSQCKTDIYIASNAEEHVVDNNYIITFNNGVFEEYYNYIDVDTLLYNITCILEWCPTVPPGTNKTYQEYYPATDNFLLGFILDRGILYPNPYEEPDPVECIIVGGITIC